MIDMTLLALLVPQQDDLILIIKFCQGVDRDSWAWWFHMCWLYEGLSPAGQDMVAAGVSAGMALGAAKLLRWFAGRR